MAPKGAMELSTFHPQVVEVYVAFRVASKYIKSSLKKTHKYQWVTRWAPTILINGVISP